MFTGSTRAGRKVAAQTAERLVGCSLELGGKNAMIVLDDADLPHLEGAATGATSRGEPGQICISIERLYVEAASTTSWSPGIEKVRALRRDAPAARRHRRRRRDEFPPQVEIVDDHVGRAREGRSRAIGGHRGRAPVSSSSRPCSVDVDHSMTLMLEETFGPTLPVMKVADAEAAVRLVNDSPYGLAPPSSSRHRARRADRAALQSAPSASTTRSSTSSRSSAPMGGVKASGHRRASRRGGDSQVLLRAGAC